MRERSVYISYTIEDAAAAARLKRDLAAANIPVPVDGNALDDELRWLPAVKQAIGRCGLFLACFSDRSTATAHSTAELKLALEQQPRGEPWLIAVKFGPCDLPAELDGLETICLYEQWELGVEHIVARTPEGEAPVSPQKRHQIPGKIHIRHDVIAGGDLSMTGGEVEIEGSTVSDKDTRIKTQ